MKKVLSLVFSFAFMFAIAGVAHADVGPTAVVCDYPDHAIYSADGTMKIGCITDSDWQAALASQRVNTPSDLIPVARGQHLLTTFGVDDFCPDWFPLSGCVIKKSLFVKWL